MLVARNGDLGSGADFEMTDPQAQDAAARISTAAPSRSIPFPAALGEHQQPHPHGAQQSPATTCLLGTRPTPEPLQTHHPDRHHADQQAPPAPMEPAAPPRPRSRFRPAGESRRPPPRPATADRVEPGRPGAGPRHRVRAGQNEPARRPSDRGGSPPRRPASPGTSCPRRRTRRRRRSRFSSACLRPRDSVCRERSNPTVIPESPHARKR